MKHQRFQLFFFNSTMLSFFLKTIVHLLCLIFPEDAKKHASYIYKIFCVIFWVLLIAMAVLTILAIYFARATSGYYGGALAVLFVVRRHFTVFYSSFHEIIIDRSGAYSFLARPFVRLAVCLSAKTLTLTISFYW